MLSRRIAIVCCRTVANNSKPTFLRNLHDKVVKLFVTIDNRKVRWWSPRGILLFILPLPLLPAFIIALAKGDLNKSFILFICMVLYLMAAVLARRALTTESIQSSYSKRKLPPPRKTLAAIAIAIATLLCAWLVVGHELLFSMMMGSLALLAFYLSYGLEPLRISSADNKVATQDEASIFNVLNEAEEKIASIETASKKVKNAELENRLNRISQLARNIVNTIEQDPRDLHRARKFLYVYLDGAQRVTQGYAKTHQRANSAELEDNFRNVLITIEEVFKQQQNRLLRDDILDLDVQIEVLNKQLKEEGI